MRICLICLVSLAGLVPTVSLHSSDDPWWRQAVFYEIHVRSFQDSNGDAVGDLPGITSRLAYLSELGVVAIWITPRSIFRKTLAFLRSRDSRRIALRKPSTMLNEH
jgi:hypothetical protein